MKVYLQSGKTLQLIGRADVPADVGSELVVPLFGAAATIVERFAIRTVTAVALDRATARSERAVIVEPGQVEEILPGFSRLAS